MIDRMIARVEAGDISAEEVAAEAPLHQGEAVGVTIILSGNVEEVMDFLQANGGTNLVAGEDYIEGFIPVLLLGRTSEQTGVEKVQLVQPPDSPQSQSQVVGDGPAVHSSIDWNQAGYNGQGIKIGIIDTGFTGFRELMGNELPSAVQVRCYPGWNQPTADLDDCDNGSVHGTEVAESIIDIAPEAELYLANPSLSRSELKDTVEWMMSEGVSVINASRVWPFDGPGDGTSPTSISPLNIIDSAVDDGIVWVNAAGNSALKTWFKRGPFSYSTVEVDGTEYRFINFGDADYKNQFYLFGPLELRWDDTWGGATRDLNLYVMRPGMDEFAISSEDVQSGGDYHYPYERIFAAVRFDIVIAQHGGTEPGWIQLLSWKGAYMEFNTSETGSIVNPAESANPGMLAVGAAPWSNVNSIEAFSSRGPTPDGRIKPDVVGADCGETASGDGDFCGTSQASPHVAGMAALVRQRFPDYAPAQVVTYLKENAEQRINSPDPNNTWGHGFIVLPPITDVVADLVVDAPTVSESAPAAGSDLHSERHGAQPGQRRIGTRPRCAYYQSTDPTIMTGDTEVGTNSVSGLDELEIGDGSISLTRAVHARDVLLRGLRGLGIR